jgi:xylulokinase
MLSTPDSPSLYVGLGCSTQSFSAVVLEVGRDLRHIVCQHALQFDRDFPSYGTTSGVHRGADRREVWSSPVMWADALDRMMAAIADALGPDRARIAAIAGSGQQHGSIYLNARAEEVWRGLDPSRGLAGQLHGTFTREQAPVWMDESTSVQCREIEQALGGAEATAQLTGSSAYERFTGPQIRKFFQQHPGEYRNTRRIHLVSSYLASLLVGADAPLDPGDGAGTNLMDLRAGRWSRSALEATAADLEARLPALQPSWTIAGTLSPFWRQRHGLPAASAVAWSGDNPCSRVGTGIIGEGRLAISLGTSDTVFACTPEPRAGASHVFGSPAGGFMSLVCFRNGSLARERIRDEHGLDWQRFSQALAASPPGNGGALMLPWFEPEITPHVSTPGVRRFALDAHDAAGNVRAVVEAQMMAMANHSEHVSQASVDRIIATGGASANRSILQVMADVFGADVYSLDVGNSACLGAALRAFHAHCLADGHPVPWPDVVKGFTDPRPDSRVTPIESHTAVYARLRPRYAELERQAAGGS